MLWLSRVTSINCRPVYLHPETSFWWGHSIRCLLFIIVVKLAHSFAFSRSWIALCWHWRRVRRSCGLADAGLPTELELYAVGAKSCKLCVVAVYSTVSTVQLLHFFLSQLRKLSQLFMPTYRFLSVATLPISPGSPGSPYRLVSYRLLLQHF